MRLKLTWLALLVSVSCNSKPETQPQPAPRAAVVSTSAPAVARDPMADIYAKVSADAVARYEMVKKTGTPIDRCVQAQMVVAAFLQAKDQTQYETWHKVQQDDCKKAGLPVE